MTIPPAHDRRAASIARDRMALRDATTAIRLARRVVLLEAVVRAQSDEIVALRATIGGTWPPPGGVE